MLVCHRRGFHKRLSSTLTSDNKPSITWKLSSSVVIACPDYLTPDSFNTLAVAHHANKQERRKAIPRPLSQLPDYRLCMLRRTSRSRFMPDAVVFPGGAVEEVDYHLSEFQDDQDDSLLLAVAGKDI